MTLEDRVKQLEASISDPDIRAATVVAFVRAAVQAEALAAQEAKEEALAVHRRMLAAERQRRHREEQSRPVTVVTRDVRDEALHRVTERDSVSPTPPSGPISFSLSSPDPERAIPVPPAPSQEPALLVFPCDGEPKEFAVVESLRKEHAEAFPSLNVMGEYRKALAWVKASPQNRKTARGMAKFLFGWLGRAQNSGAARSRALPAEQGRAPPPPVRLETRAEEKRVRSTWTEPEPAGALLDEMPAWMNGGKQR